VKANRVDGNKQSQLFIHLKFTKEWPGLKDLPKYTSNSETDRRVTDITGMKGTATRVIFPSHDTSVHKVCINDFRMHLDISP